MTRPTAHAPMRPANRLASAASIRQVYASGRRATASTAGCVGTRGVDGPPLVAVVAGRKLGGAVARNRAKRRLRAAIDPLIERMAPGAMVVVGATSQTNEAAFPQVAADVETVLTRIGVIRSA